MESGVWKSHRGSLFFRFFNSSLANPGGKEEEKPTLPHVKLQVEGLENALLAEEEEEEEE